MYNYHLETKSQDEKRSSKKQHVKYLKAKRHWNIHWIGGSSKQKSWHHHESALSVVHPMKHRSWERWTTECISSVICRLSLMTTLLKASLNEPSAYRGKRHCMYLIRLTWLQIPASYRNLNIRVESAVYTMGLSRDWYIFNKVPHGCRPQGTHSSQVEFIWSSNPVYSNGAREAVNFLLNWHAVGDLFIKTDIGMMRFARPPNTSPTEYAKPLWNYSLSFNREYDENVLNGIFIELFPDSVC